MLGLSRSTWYEQASAPSALNGELMRRVDEEVRRIIDEQYALARRLIEENSDKMHAMAKALLDWETIDSEQLDAIMEGREPQPPKDWAPRTPPKGDGDAGGGTAPATVTAPATPPAAPAPEAKPPASNPT